MTIAYAQPADFVKRYDARVLGDLVGDANVRVDSTSLLTNDNIQAVLDDASGVISAAVQVAQKYNPADLLAMTGTDLAFLVRLTCDLAYGFLVRRRGQVAESYPQFVEALQVLDLLRSGERVFGIASNEADGNPSASFPTATDYSRLQLIRDVSKWFPVRRDQRVTGS